jgi:hypothetical protein
MEMNRKWIIKGSMKQYVIRSIPPKPVYFANFSFEDEILTVNARSNALVFTNKREANKFAQYLNHDDLQKRKWVVV